MEFRLAFDPPAFQQKIHIHDKIIMVGSCFTDHMHAYFSTYKFNCLDNPHGTLFNPISIFKSIEQYIVKQEIKQEELFYQNGIWNHWDFHSRLSHHEKDIAVNSMNSAISNAHDFLKQSNWLIITLGSGFVYEYKEQFIVANCHKVPTADFKKRMLSIQEIEDAFKHLYLKLKSLNPELKFVFTISPVRHLRDGFVENNRSKSVLIHSVSNLINDEDVLYFPSYELIIDDLRDYRFYAEDMVHPNYLSTQYVWEKFCITCIDGKTRAFMKELDQLNNAVKHIPMHPKSKDHLKFMEKFKQIALDLSSRFPELNWDKELAHFTQN